MMAMCWNQRSLLRESTGIGRPLRRQVFGQFEKFIAELQSHDAHTQAEEPLQVFVFRACHFYI